MLSLLVFGALLSAVAGVPGIVITHMTLLLHLEFEGGEEKIGEENTEQEPAAEGEDKADDSAHSGDSG